MTSRLCLAAAIAVLILAGTARAELPNGATLTFDMLKIHEDDGDLKEPTDPDTLRFYLNLAHCVCGKAGAGKQQTLSYNVELSVDTNSNKPLEFFVGTSCDMDDLRPTMCRSIGNIADIDTLVNPQDFEFSFFDVVNGNDTVSACRETDGGTANLWALVDTNGDTTYEHAQSVPISTSTVTGFDTKAPPLPTNFKGAAAENKIRIEWTVPTTTSDVRGYQAFCWKAADLSPGKASPGITPLYQTTNDVCGIASSVALTATDLSVTGASDVDAGAAATTTVPDGVATLDSSFLCKSSETATAGEIVIDGLENGTAYGVAVVAVDRYGNFAGVTFSQTVTPAAAIDFWEDLHDRGSNVEGGFCLTGEVGRGAAGGVGAIVLAFGFVVRRRKRARTLMLALPFVLLSMAPRSALAQQPYWANGADESAATLEEEDAVHWHVGVRIGPYTPAIDDQLGADPGPYEQMFGGSRVLPMLDVDRIVWRGSGQLGFGGSVGYMQKTANAYVEGSAPGDDRMRSEGDENTFRLIPIHATAIYRATQLDDLYGIPVVPYARAGLAYYIWSLRTNGSTSKACWDGTHTDGCDADKGYGGTIGFVASVGLAIRAERIDADTALSMRSGGIHHAGFFGELQMARVDGFGSDAKLSVGDTTWFVGANFEF